MRGLAPKNFKQGIDFEGVVYGLSGKNTIVALIKLSWFPLRRFLRRGKRCLKYLIYWLYLLVPFALVCAAVLTIAAIAGAISANEIPSIAISIVLGSFLLLVIKDIWDKETTRNRTLNEQLEVYNLYIYKVERGLSAITRLYGIPLPHEASSPLSQEVSRDLFIEKIRSSKFQKNNLEKHVMIKQCVHLARAFAKLESEMEHFEFIDINDSNLGLNFQLSQEGIQALSDSSLTGNIETAPDDIIGIVNSSFHIFACLRRPWRYPMDIRHKAALEKWLKGNCLWSKPHFLGTSEHDQKPSNKTGH